MVIEDGLEFRVHVVVGSLRGVYGFRSSRNCGERTYAGCQVGRP